MRPQFIEMTDSNHLSVQLSKALKDLPLRLQTASTVERRYVLGDLRIALSNVESAGNIHYIITIPMHVNL